MAKKDKRKAFNRVHMFVDFYHVAMIAHTKNSDEHLGVRCEKATYMHHTYKHCMLSWVMCAPN